MLTQFSKTLHNLSKILDMGQEYADHKKFDVQVLLNARLAPDQFNLTRQVQIACDTAKLCAARLAGAEAPAHPDTETTLPELKARIESIIGYLDSFKEDQFSEAAQRKITTPRWDNKYLYGQDYLQQHAIPNFYFHITTAYSILRHNGVDVGKKHFLGELPFHQ